LANVKKIFPITLKKKIYKLPAVRYEIKREKNKNKIKLEAQPTEPVSLT
jgi:hypothetical protein